MGSRMPIDRSFLIAKSPDDIGCPHSSLRGRPSACSQCLQILCVRVPVTATGFDRRDLYEVARVSARQLRLESAPAEAE